MKAYGPTVIRIALGALFLGAGLLKLAHPGVIQALLSQAGFPAVEYLAVLLMAVELTGGIFLLLGWQTRYVTLPLAFVILVAILTVAHKDPMHLLRDIGILGGLLSLALTGSGRLCLDRHEH
jgi:putative oxidoreductase